MKLKYLWWFNIILFLIVFACLFKITINNKNEIITTKKQLKFKQLKVKEKYKSQIQLLSNYIKMRKSSTPKEVADKIAYEIITQSRKNNISDSIIVGIIEIESMWNVYSKSKADAKGLMQILKEDNVEILPKKAFDISYNISKGIEIFKSKLKKSNGDITLALKMYVGGDSDYHKAVYIYLGQYALYKISASNVELSKKIKIIKG